MIGIFKKRPIFVPKKWANEIVAWIRGIRSSTGTIKVSNTLSPSGEFSMSLDTNIDLLADSVADDLLATYGQDVYEIYDIPGVDEDGVPEDMADDEGVEADDGEDEDEELKVYFHYKGTVKTVDYKYGELFWSKALTGSDYGETGELEWRFRSTNKVVPQDYAVKRKGIHVTADEDIVKCVFTYSSGTVTNAEKVYYKKRGTDLWTFAPKKPAFEDDSVDTDPLWWYAYRVGEELNPEEPYAIGEGDVDEEHFVYPSPSSSSGGDGGTAGDGNEGGSTGGGGGGGDSGATTGSGAGGDQLNDNGGETPGDGNEGGDVGDDVPSTAGSGETTGNGSEGGSIGCEGNVAKISCAVCLTNWGGIYSSDPQELEWTGQSGDSLVKVMGGKYTAYRQLIQITEFYVDGKMNTYQVSSTEGCTIPYYVNLIEIFIY